MLRALLPSTVRTIKRRQPRRRPPAPVVAPRRLAELRLRSDRATQMIAEGSNSRMRGISRTRFRLGTTILKVSGIGSRPFRQEPDEPFGSDAPTDTDPPAPFATCATLAPASLPTVASNHSHAYCPAGSVTQNSAAELG